MVGQLLKPPLERIDFGGAEQAAERGSEGGAGVSISELSHQLGVVGIEIAPAPADGKRHPVVVLIHGNFGPGDKLVDTRLRAPSAYALGFITRDGQHKVLLVNKRDRTFVASLPGAAGGRLEVVDQQTVLQPPAVSQLPGDDVTLGGFAVAVVTLPK